MGLSHLGCHGWAWQVILTNPTVESIDFRVIFHIAAPKKITGPVLTESALAHSRLPKLHQGFVACAGVAAALHNGTTKRPSGLHLQIRALAVK